MSPISHSVNITFADKWFDEWEKQTPRPELCVAQGVESGGTVHYNVVYRTMPTYGNIGFLFMEGYVIGASGDDFREGAIVCNSTKKYDIAFNQKFTVNDEFIGEYPKQDTAAPSNGFLFNNQRKASCLLYNKTGEETRPIYVSAGGKLPPGTEKLIPKPVVRLWIAPNVKSDAMYRTLVRVMWTSIVQIKTE